MSLIRGSTVNFYLQDRTTAETVPKPPAESVDRNVRGDDDDDQEFITEFPPPDPNASRAKVGVSDAVNLPPQSRAMGISDLLSPRESEDVSLSGASSQEESFSTTKVGVSTVALPPSFSQESEDFSETSMLQPTRLKEGVSSASAHPPDDQNESLAGLGTLQPTVAKGSVADASFSPPSRENEGLFDSGGLQPSSSGGEKMDVPDASHPPPSRESEGLFDNTSIPQPEEVYQDYPEDVPKPAFVQPPAKPLPPQVTLSEARVEPETGILEGEPGEILDDSNVETDVGEAEGGKANEGVELEEGEMKEESDVEVRNEPLGIMVQGKCYMDIERSPKDKEEEEAAKKRYVYYRNPLKLGGMWILSVWEPLKLGGIKECSI